MKKSAEVQQQYFNEISELYTIRDSADDTVIDEQIEKYIRKHMTMDLLKKAAQNLDKEDVIEDIADHLRDVARMDISGKQQEIIDVLHDEEYKRAALSTLHTNTIPTGFKSLDTLNSGGLAKGELGLISAISGTGKTLLLTNLATNYVKMGYTVLFIALEELENRMILKFEQSMLGRTRSQILNGTELDEAAFEKRQSVYKKNKDRLGNLYFSRYSPGTITPAKVEQLISDVTLRKGKHVDVVIIDYPELLRNPKATGNEAVDSGKLFEEMRRIAQDFNVVMWTASQMNRSAYSALVKTAEHIEGGLRKKNAVELLLVVNQYQEEFNAGFLRLYADKLRNPPEGHFDRMIGMKVVGAAQRVRDYESEEERKEHMAILEEVDNRMDSAFKGKKKGNKDNVDMPDYSSEINKAITAARGGGA
ncbi:putative helicase [Bacillus phage Bp8p-C]|uniref:Putative helicase n=2 Tax=Agatevirus Bp8pC TaxID=1910937 RepID=A0A0A0PUQ0_9CAUD|nr:helicase DnaB-like [Bacillus phage Bp8p-C]YP_009784396.1 putative helicase [Bacillus phage Bp8p-T]AHJ87526.1 putative helicase [Bacillus phage Bp8p-C]AHJ87737.1 putative helicase [Bacillus phage Bp8p-T]